MGALGHFLERQGIPTTGISLVREHTETVRPPRALWVTFELGRPMGIPDDAPFQRRVVKAALDLLARTDGPLIADYPEHVAEAGRSSAAGPARSTSRRQSTDSLAAEIDRFATWYDRAVAAHGRTTVGVSGLDMPAAGALVTQALDGALPRGAGAQGGDRRSARLLSRGRLGLSRSRLGRDAQEVVLGRDEARQGAAGAAAQARRQRRSAAQDPGQPDADPGDRTASPGLRSRDLGHP